MSSVETPTADELNKFSISSFKGIEVGKSSLSSHAPVEEQAAAFRMMDTWAKQDELEASTLIKMRGTSSAAATDEPLGTISAGGLHHAEVRAFLLKYYGADQDPRLDEPLHTVTSKDRFGLVTIHGQEYQIVDIGLRMLSPGELFRAQGFPVGYQFQEVPDWEKLFVDGMQVADVASVPRRLLTKSSQVRMCGNSVRPPMAKALILANFTHEKQIVRAA